MWRDELEERIIKLEKQQKRMQVLLIFGNAAVIAQCFVIIKWVVLR